ncbi:unnamed protein product, partial [Cylicostephanus goldi]
PTFSTLSCKPRVGGTPVPLGVFINSAPTKSLDKKLFDAKPAIQLALNYIQNHSCILDGFKLELIYKDTKKHTYVSHNLSIINNREVLEIELLTLYSKKNIENS